MEKMQELIKEGKLSKTLMADKKFVEGAKKILKDENIEMDDKKLAELMDQIEANLSSKIKVSDDELANVAGGAAARSMLVTSSAVIGAATAALASNLAFPASRTAVLDIAYCYPKDPISHSLHTGEETHEKTRMNYGSTALAVGAGGAGAYVGTKIGQYISDKMGLA